MRTTLRNNQELIETFNAQSQTFGKCGNLFFEGDTLYSYGYHYPLAKFIGYDTILINDTGYSVTTSKHISLARSITSKRKEVLISRISIPHVYYQMKKLYEALKVARKPHIYKTKMQILWDSFNSNVSDLKGFYLIVNHNGYFSKSAEIQFLSVSDDMPSNYLTQLKDITKMHKDSLNF